MLQERALFDVSEAFCAQVTLGPFSVWHHCGLPYAVPITPGDFFLDDKSVDFACPYIPNIHPEIYLTWTFPFPILRGALPTSPVR